jgi:pilus assembly protein Flp/PilA
MLKLWIKSQNLVQDCKDKLQALRTNESGATMIEYSILIGLITVALVATIIALRPLLVAAWEAVVAAFPAAPAA